MTQGNREALKAAREETLFTVFLGEAAPAGWEPVDEVYFKANGIWSPEGPTLDVLPLEGLGHSEYDNRPAIALFTGAGVGTPDNNSWMSANNVAPNRLNFKFEDAEKFVRFIVNNWGGSTTLDRGVQNINIYGTNDEAEYLNTTPLDLSGGGLTLIYTGVLAANTLGTQDIAEWQTLEVIEAQKSIAYKYLVIDCLDNYGNTYTGIYHINAIVRS